MYKDLIQKKINMLLSLSQLINKVTFKGKHE